MKALLISAKIVPLAASKWGAFRISPEPRGKEEGGLGGKSISLS
jgi:hypothetical protein